MNISLIIILLLILLAVIELFWHIKIVKKLRQPITYIWIAICIFALVRYFRSNDFDFALLLVLATAIAGIVALLDLLFLRKQRIAKAQAETGSDRPQETEAYQEPLIVEYSRSFFSGFITCSSLAFIYL